MYYIYTVTVTLLLIPEGVTVTAEDCTVDNSICQQNLVLGHLDHPVERLMNAFLQDDRVDLSGVHHAAFMRKTGGQPWPSSMNRT